MVAHRGSTLRAPENTLAACEAALALGANGVELDVCVTKDGHVVLWHDRDPDAWVAVARQTGIDSGAYAPVVAGPERLVSQLLLDEVLRTHGYVREEVAALVQLGLDPPEPIPVERLSPALAWLATQPRLHRVLLDVKLHERERDRVPPLVRALDLAFAEYPSLKQRRVQLLCPRERIFTAVRDELARYPALAGVLPTPDFELGAVLSTARRLGARHVSLGATLRRSWAEVASDLLDCIRARDRGVLDSVTVWTLNDSARIQQVSRWGVDAIITDDCEACLRWCSAESREELEHAGACAHSSS